MRFSVVWGSEPDACKNIPVCASSQTAAILATSVTRNTVRPITRTSWLIFVVANSSIPNHQLGEERAVNAIRVQGSRKCNFFKDLTFSSFEWMSARWHKQSEKRPEPPPESRTPGFYLIESNRSIWEVFLDDWRITDPQNELDCLGIKPGDGASGQNKTCLPHNKAPPPLSCQDFFSRFLFFFSRWMKLFQVPGQ